MPCRAHKARLAAKQRAQEEEAGASSAAPAPAAATPTAATPTALTYPPMINPETADIRLMSPMERRALGEGMVINIFSGTTRIAKIPRRLFMASSTKASSLLDGSLVRLPEVVDTAAIERLVGWLISVTEKAKVPVLVKSTELISNVRLCRVARVLGMFKYIVHIHSTCWAEILHLTPDFDLLAAFETLANPVDDPYIVCSAKRLRTLLRSNKMTKESFDTLLANFPLVTAAVKELDEAFARGGRGRQRAFSAAIPSGEA